MLDLDALIPESKSVKLGGKVYNVLPPSYGDIVNLQKATALMGEYKVSNFDVVEKYNEIVFPVLQSLIVNVTIEELMKLGPAALTSLQAMIFEMVTPTYVKELKENGLEPASDSGKKV